MSAEHRPGGGGVGEGIGHVLASSTTPSSSNGHAVFNNSSFDRNTFVLMLLAILLPIALIVILCVVTYCIYKYNRKLASRTPTDASIVPSDRFDARTATVIYNTQHSPFIFEDLPPSYDSLGDSKKHPSSTTTNPNEQFSLTILPNTTLTDTDERIEAVVIDPTAPTPPPSYINLDESNKS
ncbi:unnamed protein product [Rotaria sp. Silwood2]|nr:unnamed protein product [Rotaria sp. Silwood2]CAF2567126.1 unnamed protein product [Rotaria sp. Silwood2]CAF2811727.1 unnamed protein product [Rotaria sp. Silwood2]CAF2970456.1 unnamed protein product [Rotaria sp. Silwood2]CAF4105710.1 unnamed protein product [Rotaria sp. Silwood2]